MNLSGTYDFVPESADTLIREMQRDGWRVYRLPAGMTSREEFFVGVVRTLPLDVPASQPLDWDTLPAALARGLDRSPEVRVAIVWPDASAFAAAAEGDAIAAAGLLAGLAGIPARRAASEPEHRQWVVLRVL